MSYYRLNIVLLLMLLSSSLASQSLLSSGAATQTSTTYTISWSLGELMTNTLNSNNYQLTQGFHQGLIIESSTPLGVKDKFKVDIYPNPVDKWILISHNEPGHNWSYSFSDLNGRELYSDKNIQSAEKLLDVSSHAEGTYLLRIFQGKRIQSFKIIINH